jgi:hypothetical protein
VTVSQIDAADKERHGLVLSAFSPRAALPQAGLVDPILFGACFAFLAARFSFRDFPAFFAESFCGDLFATSSSF